ncbi:MAG: hypothetical protein FWB83_03630 [Treponema sp.]|nr:hypothetical protein [Treponema sp.]
MKKAFKIITFLVLLAAALPANSYIVTYKEQFYRLFHVHYIQYPEDSIENIYWLEQALRADFANPLYAIALIENEIQWEKYRYLFMMHLNIKMLEQHLLLGNKYNKRNAYFYNAPWRDENLASLDIAETCYRTALYYWNEAQSWAARANERRFRWIDLPRVQYWIDEAVRIERGSLNYGRTINRELQFLQRVRERFQEMDNHYVIQDTTE